MLLAILSPNESDITFSAQKRTKKSSRDFRSISQRKEQIPDSMDDNVLQILRVHIP
jgi:hypothetical protein